MVENEKSIDKKNIINADKILDIKLNYLNQIKDALNYHNDFKLYKLIHDPKYYITDNKYDDLKLNKTIKDMYKYISHYLSVKLIDYLGKIYPFFYYDEYQLGKFNIYFGKWWGHKLFGNLDVLNVKLHFNNNEYKKLQDSFVLSKQNSTVNSKSINNVTNNIKQLQMLIDSQKQRDKEKRILRKQLKDNASKSKLPWDTNKIKEEKNNIIKQLSEISEKDDAALNANQQIKNNENKILELSKNDTILKYEQESISKYFNTFDHFINNNSKLYSNYINKLFKEKQVNDYNE